MALPHQPPHLPQFRHPERPALPQIPHSLIDAQPPLSATHTSATRIYPIYPWPSPNLHDPKDHTVADPHRQHIWNTVATSPIHNLWDFQGVPPLTVLKRTFTAFNDDNLVSRAAELGYYFLFALFPTLVSASALFGLVVRSSTLYLKLLNYLAIVVPPDAFKIVLETFNQTTLSSSGGKLILGLAAAIWSASVGFSAIQDTLNIVYKVKETRPYWKVKAAAIVVTMLLAIILILTLSCLLLGSYSSHFLRELIANKQLGLVAGIAAHVIFDIATCAMLVLLFAVIYYFAPDVQNKIWRWLTPGAAIGIACWFLASMALRLYLHYSHSYSVTYGSLGAVIILLTWFYITGLTLLLGAEINSEIEAAVAERKLKEQGAIPDHVEADKSTA